jgi:hypothetical protein
MDEAIEEGHQRCLDADMSDFQPLVKWPAREPERLRCVL